MGFGGPNPSRAPFRIAWAFEARQRAEATVFDVAGRQVRVLYSGLAGPGEVSLVWDGADARGRAAPAGVYFLRMRAGAFGRTIKVVR